MSASSLCEHDPGIDQWVAMRGLVAELRRHGLYDRETTHVSYLVRLGTTAFAGDAVVELGADGDPPDLRVEWMGNMLRLSRAGPVTRGRLLADARYIAGLLDRYSGRWEALVVEDLRPDPYWQDLGRRLLEPAPPAPVSITIPAQADRTTTASRGLTAG